MKQERQQDTAVVTMVHEMREPVQAIRGFLSILLAERAGNLTESQRDFLSTANRAAGRLSRLIDDLELLRFAATTMNVNPTQVDLAASVDACIAELHPIATNLSMDFEVAVESGDDLTVPGDPGRIDQILLNLLENALKYGTMGTPIRVRLRGGCTKVLCVVENTVPMDTNRENPRDWFQPYARRRKPLERSSANGFGLGLTVVDTLVRAHYGRTVSRVEEDRVSIGFVLPRYSPLHLDLDGDHAPANWNIGEELLRTAC